MPSILDRLIDPEADFTMARQGYTPSQMVAAVQRDLEDLLNTRSSAYEIPPQCKEALDSILSFGMPDLSQIEATTDAARARIGRVLEQIILRFEPRLKDVRATLLPGHPAMLRYVKFRVEGKLRVEPSPEVAFDTVVELTTGHSTVAPATGGAT
jgi:type VI secretion system protein ImpF